MLTSSEKGSKIFTDAASQSRYRTAARFCLNASVRAHAAVAKTAMTYADLSPLANHLWQSTAGRPAYTTVQTVVYRLERKKALRCVKRISNAHLRYSRFMA